MAGSQDRTGGEHVSYAAREVQWPRARIILEPSKVNGGRYGEIGNQIHLVPIDRGPIGTEADYLMVGLQCSEEYASKISAKDDILVLVTIAKAELHTFEGHESGCVEIQFTDAMVVESGIASDSEDVKKAKQEYAKQGHAKQGHANQGHEARKARAAYLIQYIIDTGNEIDRLNANGRNPQLLAGNHQSPKRTACHLPK